MYATGRVRGWLVYKHAYNHVDCAALREWATTDRALKVDAFTYAAPYRTCYQSTNPQDTYAYVDADMCTHSSKNGLRFIRYVWSGAAERTAGFFLRVHFYI